MAEILLFHHAQGQTDGFVAFADELRAAGHVVHAPDLSTYPAQQSRLSHRHEHGHDDDAAVVSRQG